jgi:steroid delta-isomerase-like uncharacterized protein
MKKQLLTLALFSTFSIVYAQTKVEKILDNYMKAWEEHNITKIDTFYAEDVAWYDLPSDSTIKGKKKMSKAITDAFMGYVPDMYWAKSGDVFVSNNTIIYEWVYGGTFDGKWGDVEVKKKKFSIKGISTTTFNDEGKIIFQKDYYDMYEFQKQLGLIH